ncbi:MAG: tRNA uridine(34) 5-carboxymethylaminomethyl modification radical SAM/GNAT enzyme Elp3 [bacterium]
MINEISKFIIELDRLKISSKKDFLSKQRDFARGTDRAFFTNDKLLQAYHKLVSNKIIQSSEAIEHLLTLKLTRSNSGIVVTSVLTKPYACPGKCLYCPSEADMPKSYLAKEPAVMRAITCKFDPYLQVKSRLRALTSVGHNTDKVNIRIVGGTWSYYPVAYQNWFVRRLFEAANEDANFEIKELKDLISLQTKNETAKHRVVEISAQTRQEYINDQEIIRLRKLSVTKVELGVQSIYDKVLLFNKRGNLTIDTINATKMLKRAGFKVSYQMMLNLPESNMQTDVEIFKELFENPDYQPDHLKIYPLALVKEAPVYNLYKKGGFKPYTKEELIEVIKKIKQYIPYYARVERVIRDIPAEYIVEGGAKVSNLRQEIGLSMAKEGAKCNCIRCREVKGTFDKNENYQLFHTKYESSAGTEYFLSIESDERKKLYSMLRLTLPNIDTKPVFSILNHSALVREIHTYGPQMSIGQTRLDAPQHQGFGKMLMKEAEKIAKADGRYDKIAVIAGIGVREYFRKLGYTLKETYMVKRLNDE